MNKKGTILALVVTMLMMFVMIGGINLYSYNKIIEAEEFIEHCKANGYDGIRFEQVNILKEVPHCANFTDLERVENEFYSKRDKGFNNATRDVMGALLDKSSQNDGGTP